MTSNQIRWRSFISLSIFLGFTILFITSLLMFLKPHRELVALLHTIFGFWLLLLLLWHIKNNLKPLKNYLRNTGTAKINIAPLGSAGVFVVLLILVYYQTVPFMQFYRWGQTLRAATANGVDEQQTYQIRRVQPAIATGETFTIEFRKGPFFMWPQYAIWLETLDGKFIQPLYVTGKLAHNNFANKVTRKKPQQVFIDNPLAADMDAGEIFEYQWDTASKNERKRPESLPVFLHALGLKSADGAMVPEVSTPILDAYSGATMRENFQLTTKSLTALPEKFRIRFEINQSFDFNTYYSSDRFPDDEVYSGDGYSAQPSVIYEAVVDRNDKQPIYLLKLAGQGHHSGKDGEINPDTSNLTTATQLVDRILVEFYDAQK
ncbi:DUF4405 domain-containing protein [Cellvibrio mixtus]|uniref:DUF4405 domain-containing protein n=1 Tax=Cellvibrio mixtus TaxID=39650 RepID=UPI00058703EF|nr:DUF4405 domain-containing protein [Cellvibrio mixtus]